MRNKLKPALLLAFVMALSACKHSGEVVRPPVCPTVPKPPPSLSTPINAEQRLRDELFESGQSVTPVNLRGNGTPKP